VIVVSDTSPISNFFRINQLSILHYVYGSVIIPSEVCNELKSLEGFGLNPNEIFSRPWIEIKQTSLTAKFHDSLKKIHLGEAAAIALAKELNIKYVLIDDRKGQQLSLQQNLYPIGTLGTLKLAKEKGIITEVKKLLDEIILAANYG